MVAIGVLGERIISAEQRNESFNLGKTAKLVCKRRKYLDMVTSRITSKIFNKMEKEIRLKRPSIRDRFHQLYNKGFVKE